MQMPRDRGTTGGRQPPDTSHPNETTRFDVNPLYLRSPASPRAAEYQRGYRRTSAYPECVFALREDDVTGAPPTSWGPARLIVYGSCQGATAVVFGECHIGPIAFLAGLRQAPVTISTRAHAIRRADARRRPTLTATSRNSLRRWARSGDDPRKLAWYPEVVGDPVPGSILVADETGILIAPLPGANAASRAAMQRLRRATGAGRAEGALRGRSRGH